MPTAALSVMINNSSDSEWYKRLVSRHGRDAVSIGVVPFSREEKYWIRTVSEDRSSPEEHSQFAKGLMDIMRAFRRSTVPTMPALDAPMIVGDYFVVRTETLVFSPGAFRLSPVLILELLATIQGYLAQPPHKLWRVTSLFPRESLVIYPDFVFLGACGFPDPSAMREMIVEWLTLQSTVESGGI